MGELEMGFTFIIKVRTLPFSFKKKRISCKFLNDLFHNFKIYFYKKNYLYVLKIQWWP